MQDIISSLGQNIYENNGHYGYLIKFKKISVLCKKWSRNRDCDNNRVNDIYDYYINGGYVPNILHLAELNDEGLICYDGNHRREVFTKYINNYDKDIFCIIDILFNSTQNDVYNAFNNINKAVQLPAIYLDNNENILGVKNEIIDLVKSYEKKYKSFLSTSSRPQAPNFNRDNFVEILYELYKYFSGTLSINEIHKYLQELNNEYSHERFCKSHNTYKETLINKCKKHNFWLFIDRILHIEHIKLLVENKKK
jgi:hypothetical protein